MMGRSRIARTRLGLLSLGLALGLTSAARAQGPGPVPEPTPAAGIFVPNEEAYKSGLLTRYTPAPAVLPHDKDRDRWYNTRWGDYLPDLKHPNFMCNSGLYGQRIRPTCTATYAPYFSGRAGQTTSGKCCEPVRFRVISNFFHPWRPVGGFYHGGAASPIYDLDPFAPGPGPFPYPWLYKRQHQGG